MAKHPKEEKTNVVRILEAAGIPCTAYEVPLPKGEVPDGVTAAKLLGKPPEQVFKTLVAQGPKGEHFVFVIPVAETLDLKKAAHAVGEKSVAMLPQKELLPLTGYVHGGCSPVGMKKLFPTVFHETAASLPVIMVSAGKLGRQIACDPKALLALVRADTADIITEE